ncbi:hypothetical protein PROFUN_16537 [Planoprotostelium fungivorum]|uniref:Uncharacterized protein n=1 Tax=Planoprotostelium fungivorum TaxID=1890364 RepID=A0A2P6MQJ7_9EUKA|nr:hypothetical protein PROFUN_16537 [Planoprotostelium fungivorum]
MPNFLPSFRFFSRDTDFALLRLLQGESNMRDEDNSRPPPRVVAPKLREDDQNSIETEIYLKQLASVVHRAGGNILQAPNDKFLLTSPAGWIYSHGRLTLALGEGKITPHAKTKSTNKEPEDPTEVRYRNYIDLLAPNILTECMVELTPYGEELVMSHENDARPFKVQCQKFNNRYILYMHCGGTNFHGFTEPGVFVYSPIPFKDPVHDVEGGKVTVLDGPQIQAGESYTTQLMYIITFIYWLTSRVDKVLPRSFTRTDVDNMKRRIDNILDPINSEMFLFFYMIENVLALPLSFFSRPPESQERYIERFWKDSDKEIVVGLYKDPQHENYSLFKLRSGVLEVFTENHPDNQLFFDHLQQLLRFFDVKDHVVTPPPVDGNDAFTPSASLRLIMVYNLLLLSSDIEPGPHFQYPDAIVDAMLGHPSSTTKDVTAQDINDLVKRTQDRILEEKLRERGMLDELI